jgi:hypothetical protein
MVCKARLRCRSPPRSGPMADDLPGGGLHRRNTAQHRERGLRPEPARVRPAGQHLRGADRPDPGLGEQRRCHGRDERAQLRLELGRLGARGQDPLGGHPQRPHGGAVLHRVAGHHRQRSAGAGLPGARCARAGCPAAARGGDDQRRGLPAGVRAHLDDGGAGGGQHPDRLPVAALAWGGQVLAGQRPCRPAPMASRASLVAPLRPRGRLGRSLSTTHPGRGRAGSWSARPGSSRSPPRAQTRRPGACALARSSSRACPAGSVGTSRVARTPPLGASSAAACGVAVGVDPDDGVDAALSHGHRGCLRPRRRPLRGTGLGWSHRGGRTVMGHALGRTGLLIRPAAVGQAGAGSLRTDQHQGTPQGRPVRIRVTLPASTSLPAPKCRRQYHSEEFVSRRTSLGWCGHRWESLEQERRQALLEKACRRLEELSPQDFEGKSEVIITVAERPE